MREDGRTKQHIIKNLGRKEQVEHALPGASDGSLRRIVALERAVAERRERIDRDERDDRLSTLSDAELHELQAEHEAKMLAEHGDEIAPPMLSVTR